MFCAFAHSKALNQTWDCSRQAQNISTTSPPLLCPDNPQIVPVTYPQSPAHIFPWQVLFGPSHLRITSRCIPQAGSQNKAECMLMIGNILLMQKVNQGDKFKTSLCHYYRQVLQSLIRSIENIKRYGN